MGSGRHSKYHVTEVNNCHWVSNLANFMPIMSGIPQIDLLSLLN